VLVEPKVIGYLDTRIIPKLTVTVAEAVGNLVPLVPSLAEAEAEAEAILILLADLVAEAEAVYHTVVAEDREIPINMTGMEILSMDPEMGVMVVELETI
jgi:hypothetical protein